MRIKYQFDQFFQNLKSTKVTIALVLLAWLITLVAVAGLVLLYVEKTGQAGLATPSGTIPKIYLDPAIGTVGTSVTVRGEDWPAQRVVLIYLLAPGELKFPDYGVAGSVADACNSLAPALLLAAGVALSGAIGSVFLRITSPKQNRGRV